MLERRSASPDEWRVLQGALCTVFILLQLSGCATSESSPSFTKPVSMPSLEGLRLVDASFATEIRDRQPARISQTISTDEQQLSFWMELACTGLCEQRLALDDGLVVSLEWYKEEAGHLLKQSSTPLSVKGTRWRTWGSKRVTPGMWVAVVRAEDSSWVCLSQQCYFSIEVKP